MRAGVGGSSQYGFELLKVSRTIRVFLSTLREALNVVNTKLSLPLTDTARKQLSLPIRLSGLGIRNVEETMEFAYLASRVRVVYEDIEWWQANGPTETNNPYLHRHLVELIESIKQKVPKRKNKHLYPKDTNIINFIEQME